MPGFLSALDRKIVMGLRAGKTRTKEFEISSSKNVWARLDRLVSMGFVNDAPTRERREKEYRLSAAGELLADGLFLARAEEIAND